MSAPRLASPPPKFRILIIGAYGQFGRRIACALGGDELLHLVLAGRSADDAKKLALELQQRGAKAELSTATLDVESGSLQAALAQLQVELVIHAAGPFQERDYRVAEASARAGAHYIDLADGRDFVAGIDRLDGLASQQNRWIISGASSVPGLSAAVISEFQPRFSRLNSVETAISPGNRTPRGLATTRAILSYVGEPFWALVDRRVIRVHGWQSLKRMALPGVGTRWFGRCDVPDLAILPIRYPHLQHCEFRAGLELRRLHFGLWLASWLVRARLIPNLSRVAKPLLRMSEMCIGSGSDVGVMVVDMVGLGHEGQPLQWRWQVVAKDGSGPQIPATAAVVLARKLARNALPGNGARPCLDLFTLEDFMRELEGFPIQALAQEVMAKETL